MKNLAIAILLAATCVLGALHLRQGRTVTETRATVASLRQTVAEQEARLDEQEKRASNLKDRLHDTRAKAVAKADEAAQLKEELTRSAATNAKPANAVAEMFKNPEMKELIKTQQKAVFSGMIDKNYKAFFTGLQLTPEQSAGLKDLVVKKSLVDAGVGMSMISGEMDASKRSEILQQAKTEKEGIDAEIKQFLGDEAFGQFQAYEKTIPERTAIGSFKDQQASGSAALDAEQEAQLVQALTEERQKFKFTTDFYDQSKLKGDLSAYFTQENIDRFQQEKEQLDQQYLARARDILSAEQIGPFEKFLSSQRELQKTGMKMGMKMFAPKSGGN
jgi:hypothetical protein